MAIVDPSAVTNVTVALDTAPIPQRGFDTIMFLAETKVFNERWRVYNTTTDLLQDGFLSTDPAYKAFAVASAGTAKPKTIMIARRKFDTITYTPTVENSTEYSISLAAPQEGFETFSYTSDSDATATEIVNGIIADFTANASVALAAVVALSNVSDELQLTDIGSSDYAIKEVSSNLNPATAAKADFETITTALSEARAEEGVWAYFAIESRVQADVEEAYTWGESNTEMFATATDLAAAKVANQATVLDTGFTGQYLYSMGFWSADQANYPDFSALAKMASVQVPGQTTLNGKTLNGITLDNNSTLSNSESTIVRAKNSNTYESVSTFGWVRDGKTFSGQFFDIVDTARWFKARVQENIIQLQKSKVDAGTKIPFTDAGIQMIGQRIVQIVQQGIDAGVFDGNYNNGVGYQLTLPALSSIPTNDIANRVLNNVQIVVRATGAIHTITVSGTITI